jgi:hypothetical protein
MSVFGILVQYSCELLLVHKIAVFGVHHHELIICFDVSEKSTASIFMETELVQINVTVMWCKKCVRCTWQFGKTGQSHLKKVGRVPRHWEFRIPKTTLFRAPTQGRQENNMTSGS